MAMAKFHLKTMPGIDRPAIAARWPTVRGSIVLDLGASIGADAQHLVNLAVMGSAMARVLLSLERPKVGLLNIGVEEVKGLEEVREAGRICARPGPFLDYTALWRATPLAKAWSTWW
jgi:glycerol-3-phosphate acyltransferase PlsX